MSELFDHIHPRHENPELFDDAETLKHLDIETLQALAEHVYDHIIELDGLGKLVIAEIEAREQSGDEVL